MNKKIIAAATAAAIALAMASCGGNHRDAETSRIVESSTEQLNDAMRRHDLAAVSSAADSMANYLDELTPDENVSLLLAFLQLHNDAVSRHDRQADLETIRKYVDVYSIVVDENPEEMEQAFRRAMEINSKVDFEQAYKEFRLALSDYDAAQQAGEDFEDPAPAPRKAEEETAQETTSDQADEKEAAEVPAAVEPVN